MKKNNKVVKSEERHSLLFYGVLVLAVLSVIGSILVFQLTRDVQDEIEGGHSGAGGTVSLTVDTPDDGSDSSSGATGQVTLTIVKGE